MALSRSTRTWANSIGAIERAPLRKVQEYAVDGRVVARGAVEPLVTVEHLVDPCHPMVGQGVDACAVRGRLGPRRVGVQGNEQVRAGAPGDPHAFFQRDEDVRGSGHHHAIASALLQPLAQMEGRRQGNLLFIDIAGLGARVVTAVAGIDHHHLSMARGCKGARCCREVRRGAVGRGLRNHPDPGDGRSQIDDIAKISRRSRSAGSKTGERPRLCGPDRASAEFQFRICPAASRSPARFPHPPRAAPGRCRSRQTPFAGLRSWRGLR